MPCWVRPLSYLSTQASMHACVFLGPASVILGDHARNVREAWRLDRTAAARTAASKASATEAVGNSGDGIEVEVVLMVRGNVPEPCRLLPSPEYRAVIVMDDDDGADGM